MEPSRLDSLPDPLNPGGVQPQSSRSSGKRGGADDEHLDCPPANGKGIPRSVADERQASRIRDDRSEDRLDGSGLVLGEQMQFCALDEPREEESVMRSTWDLKIPEIDEPKQVKKMIQVRPHTCTTHRESFRGYPSSLLCPPFQSPPFLNRFSHRWVFYRTSMASLERVEAGRLFLLPLHSLCDFLIDPHAWRGTAVATSTGRVLSSIVY
jgi:hypothetical protein